MNLPKLDLDFNIVLKAVSNLDEMYLDEQGRHIIFRTINGNVVPIRTTAEDYVSWLETQGVVVPDDQQTFFRQVDDALYRIATVGQDNPALAMQMEKEFRNNLAQYTAQSQLYYQQAMALQAQQAGIDPQQYEQERQAQFQQKIGQQAQQPKPTNVSEEMAQYLQYERRDKLEDKGWGSHISGVTDRLIADYGAKENTPLWYTLQAFDLAMRIGLEKVMGGAKHHEVDLLEVLNEEVSTYAGFSSNFEHYQGVTSDPNLNYNLPKGIETLLRNLKGGNEGANYLSDIFDTAFEKMVDDLTEDLSSVDYTIPGKPKTSILEEVPSELPATFSKKEGTRVMEWYLGRVGEGGESRIYPSARAAAKHALIRVFNTLPEEAQTMLLQHGQGSLAAFHEHGAKQGFANAEAGIASNPERTLRYVIGAAQDSTRQGISASQKIDNLREMSRLMGELEGGFIRAQREMTLPGRQKPSFERVYNNNYNSKLLVEELSDPEKRGKQLLDNKKHLRLGPAPTKTVGGEEGLPKKESTPPTPAEGEFTRDLDAGAFIHKETGLHVKPTTGNMWGIFTPEGERLGLFTPKNVTNLKETMAEASEQIRGLSQETPEEAPVEPESESAAPEVPTTEEVAPEPEVAAPEPAVTPEPKVAEPKPTATRKPSVATPPIQRTVSNTETEYGKNVSFATKLNQVDEEAVTPIINAINANGLELTSVVDGKSDKVVLPDGTEIFLNLNPAGNAMFAIKEANGKPKVATKEDVLSRVQGASNVVTAEVDTTTPEEVPTPEVEQPEVVEQVETPTPEIVPETPETAVEQPEEVGVEEDTQEAVEESPEAPEEAAEVVEQPTSEITPEGDTLHPDLKVDHMPAEERAKLDTVTNFIRNNGLEVTESNAANNMLVVRPIGSTKRPNVDSVIIEVDKRGQLSVVPKNSRNLPTSSDFTSPENLAKMFSVDPDKAVTAAPEPAPLEEVPTGTVEPEVESVEEVTQEHEAQESVVQGNLFAEETALEEAAPEPERTSPRTSSPEWGITRNISFPHLKKKGKEDLSTLRIAVDRNNLHIETKGTGEAKQYNVLDREGNVVLGVTGAGGELQFYTPSGDQVFSKHWAAHLDDFKQEGEGTMYPTKNIEIPTLLRNRWAGDVGEESSGVEGAKALSDYIKKNKLSVTTDYNGNYIIHDKDGKPRLRYESPHKEYGTRLYDLRPPTERFTKQYEELSIDLLSRMGGVDVDDIITGKYYEDRADTIQAGIDARKKDRSQDATDAKAADDTPLIDDDASGEDIPETTESDVDKVTVEEPVTPEAPEEVEAVIEPEVTAEPEVAEEVTQEAAVDEGNEPEPEPQRENAPIPPNVDISKLSPEHQDQFTRLNNYIHDNGYEVVSSLGSTFKVKPIGSEESDKVDAVGIVLDPRRGVSVLPNNNSRRVENADINNPEHLAKMFGIEDSNQRELVEEPQETTIPTEETVEEATQVIEEPEPAAVEVPETQASEDTTVPTGETQPEPVTTDTSTGRDDKGGQQALVDLERKAKRGKVKTMIKPPKVSALGRNSLTNLERAASSGTGVSITQNEGGYDYVVGITGMFGQTAVGVNVDENGDILYEGIGSQAKKYADEKLKGNNKNLNFNHLKEMLRVWKPGELSEREEEDTPRASRKTETDDTPNINKLREERAVEIEEALVDMDEDPGTIPFDEHVSDDEIEEGELAEELGLEEEGEGKEVEKGDTDEVKVAPKRKRGRPRKKAE